MRSRLFDNQNTKSVSLEEYRQIVVETKKDLKEGEKITNETKYACEQLKHFTELFAIKPTSNYGMKATNIAIESAFRRNRIPSYITVSTEEDKRNFIQKIIDWILEKLRAFKDWITSFFKKKKTEAFKEKVINTIDETEKAFAKKKEAQSNPSNESPSGKDSNPTEEDKEAQPNTPNEPPPKNTTDVVVQNNGNSELNKPYNFVFYFDGSKFKIMDLLMLEKIQFDIFKESTKILEYNLKSVEAGLNGLKEFIKNPNKYSSKDEFFAAVLNNTRLSLSAKQIKLKTDDGTNIFLCNNILFSNVSKGIVIIKEHITKHLDKPYHFYEFAFTKFNSVPNDITDDILDYYGNNAKQSKIIEHNQALHDSFYLNQVDRESAIKSVEKNAKISDDLAKHNKSLNEKLSAIANESRDLDNEIHSKENAENLEIFKEIINDLLRDIGAINMSQYNLIEYALSYYTMTNDLFDKCRALADDETIVAKI